MNEIALIACSKSKAKVNGRIRAADLYTGNLFRAQLAYARQILKMRDEQIFILSAGYGLVWSTWEIETYDISLGGMTAAERDEWLERVAIRLSVPLLTYHPTVYMMAGKLYRESVMKWMTGRWSTENDREPIEVIVPHPLNYGYGRQVVWYQSAVRAAC